MLLSVKKPHYCNHEQDINRTDQKQSTYQQNTNQLLILF